MTAILTEYDTLVSRLTFAGVPRERAEVAARKKLGLTTAPAVSERDARILEKEEQRAIIKLFREHGFKVRSTSQARPSKIALGFPDLFCTHTALPLAWFWESKRQVKGVLSDAQKEFRADCWRCGIRCYGGDRFDAQRTLDAHHVPRTP